MEEITQFLIGILIGLVILYAWKDVGIFRGGKSKKTKYLN